MPTVLINAVPGTLPSNFCPTGATALQTFYNEIIARTVFSLSPDKAFYNFGDTTPTPENRVFPWLRTISGAPDKWYVYTSGKWVWPYPVPASTDIRQLWVGTLANLQTYDGGSTDPATTTTGPFWEEDTDFTGRSPIHPGLIDNSGVTALVGVNYGEGAHMMTANEVGPHTHPADPSQLVKSGSGSDAGIEYSEASEDNYATLLTQTNTYAPDQTAMSLIHPVRGIYIIKRTIRVYYTAT
jgi:hypothetical protein